VCQVVAVAQSGDPACQSLGEQWGRTIRDGANSSAQASIWCAIHWVFACSISAIDCAEYGLRIVFDQLAQPVLSSGSSRSGQH
jgi:hypothetical protein